MTAQPKFQVGQRVISVRFALNVNDRTAETYNTIGYYGHITAVHQHPIHKVPTYSVKLLGRNGCEAAPWMLIEPAFNPFTFWESELEAAD